MVKDALLSCKRASSETLIRISFTLFEFDFYFSSYICGFIIADCYVRLKRIFVFYEVV